MKKLLTLVALLTCFLGANAANWQEVYKIDYSQNNGFPFYVMGYVPEWVDGVMTDYGSMFTYKTEAEDGDNVVGEVQTNNGGATYQKIQLENAGWHQYFICDGIPTQLDFAYKAKAMVKASEPVNINVNMGWGWGDGEQIGQTVSIGTEWAEVEWEYSGIGGASCNLVAQPGTAAATIEWKYVIVYEDQQEQRPVVWQQWLTNDGKPIIPDVETHSFWMGDAETPWADPNVKFDDQSQNYLICAWGKEREVNMNDDGGWDPFPATIEEEGGNHYFVVHGKEATTEGDAAAWDNQFWIQSPREWKSGTTVRVKFRYKASKNVTVATQCHKQNPSDYLIWHAIGDVNFTTEWQDFENTMQIGDDMGGTWSVAFQLNQNDKEAIDFYFDDLSWESMVLDEGLFIASCNTTTGLEYDFDNAKEIVYDPGIDACVVEVGESGAYVNEVMISTVRGNTTAFKGATLKPVGAIISDEDEWVNYTESAVYKIKLPGEGIWQIAVDTVARQMNFVMIEGEVHDPLPEIPNTTEVVVKAKERQYTEAEGADVEGLPENIGTDENPWGQPWDSQFWIKANRKLASGESTIIKFKYKSTVDAKVSTQCHADPGSYLHWGAIGDVNFVAGDEWQEFEATFVVPSEANNMQSIAFNMAEIKSDCDYYITDVIWMTEDHFETLINTEGADNFYVKEYAGDAIHIFGQKKVKGDVNGDETVDVADISAILTVMSGDTSKFSIEDADVNEDTVVDVADISSVLTVMAGGAAE